MLYDSTKTLLHGILRSLESADQEGWAGRAESGRECLYEMHQMAQPGRAVDPLSRSPGFVPVCERAARAIPHVKSMVRAIRRKDQAAAVESGRAALALM